MSEATDRGRNIRRWLAAYLYEEVPSIDMELAAIAAGFEDGVEARSYLCDVLNGAVGHARTVEDGEGRGTEEGA